MKQYFYSLPALITLVVLGAILTWTFYYPLVVVYYSLFTIFYLNQFEKYQDQKSNQTKP